MTEQANLIAQVIEDSSQVPQYYSNVVRASTNIYGTSLNFAQARPVGVEGGASVIDVVCTVHMSPAQTKALFIILRQQLRDYEREWGRIPVIPDLEERFGGVVSEVHQLT